MARVPDVDACTTTLYAFSKAIPPQPVTFTVKESVAAVFGVPARSSEVVVLDTFAVTPLGSAPDAIVHLYGVQPPLALMIAEYALPTVAPGSELVVMATVPKHCAPSASRRREKSNDFTDPCCRRWGIPDSHRSWQTAAVFVLTVAKLATSHKKHRGFHTTDFLLFTKHRCIQTGFHSSYSPSKIETRKYIENTFDGRRMIHA